jgi:hypothetical protein
MVVTATGTVTSDAPGADTASTTTDIAGPGYPDRDKDTISGGGGNDTINGQNGKDSLDGGEGTDTIGGGPSDDTLYGGTGDDLLEGHGGVDALYGEGGNDRLHGGGSIPATDQVDTGGNKLDGGAGNDVCSKGPAPNFDKRKNCESISALSVPASSERTIAGVRRQAGARSGSTQAVTAASPSKRYAYRVQATYTLTRDAVDPATGLHTTVERRLAAEYKLWAKVTADQVYTGTSGDYAAVQGTAVASVRSEGAATPCTQTVETKGGIGLKFATSRAPLTAVYVSWAPGTATRLPALPCGAGEIEQWETGKRGVGDWDRLSGTSLWHESRTTFVGDVFARLAAGRNASYELTLSAPGLASGATRSASLQLLFTRAADLDPKPAPSSSKAVVVTRPAITVGRYNASVSFAVTRGGERTGVGKVSCAGSFAGGPGLYGSPTAYVMTFPRVHPALLKFWPELRTAKGIVTYLQCGYEHDEYTKACGKTFRGTLRLVVDGNRTVTKRFSFPWKAKGYAC